MSFFKKLKDRLLTLNLETNASEQKKDIHLQKVNNDITFAKKQAKQEKLLQKSIRRKLKSQNQINKYVVGLEKTGFSFAQKIREIQSRHHKINDSLFEEIEEALIMTDISAHLVAEILFEVKKAMRLNNRDNNLEQIAEVITEKIFVCYANRSLVDTRLLLDSADLNIALIVGVNGSGKTTSLAKIGKLLKARNQKVLVAAADTFRAGAIEQLAIWARRTHIDIVKPKQANSDPGAVVYEAIKKAQTENYDVLLIDTAGRLQNKVNLMQELAKINKIIKRFIPKAPHETLLVLDATTGQNGLSQAKHFTNIVQPTGIILTKMDGTSKGGIVLSIKDQLNLPVKLIGLGEKVDDLQEFDLDTFIYGLAKNLMESP